MKWILLASLGVLGFGCVCLDAVADPRGGAPNRRPPPPISPNDFTDPARPRPLFHRLFTKSCACITTDLITTANKICLNFT